VLCSPGGASFTAQERVTSVECNFRRVGQVNLQTEKFSSRETIVVFVYVNVYNTAIADSSESADFFIS
jgi:hypothetical protein